MRILCLQLKRIGDAILTAPALQALREAHPAAHISLVLHGPSGQLGPAFSAVDEAVVYRPGRPNLDVWREVVGWDWDACYDFTGTDRSALMTKMSRAVRRIGYEKFASRRAWRTRVYTSLCSASVRDLSTRDFHLALTGCAAPRGSGFSTSVPVAGRPVGEYLVIHPGTARADKYWPAERWAAVIQHLAPRRVLLTGSDDQEEKAHLADILEQAGHPRHVTDLSGKFTLLELASLLRGARLVLGVDSAAMHLAAAFQTPQIALFGPTNPFHWAPQHPHATTLTPHPEGTPPGPRTPGLPMSELSTERVFRAIDSALAGAPPAVA